MFQFLFEGGKFPAHIYLENHKRMHRKEYGSLNEYKMCIDVLGIQLQ